MAQQHAAFVGILVSRALFRGIPAGRIGHEAISLYEKAGMEFGVTPCFFRLEDISPDMQTARAYVRSAEGYRKQHVELPLVIHNRAIHQSLSAKRTLQRVEQSGRTIFNRWNRYPKQYIHDLLMLEPALWPHLPETLPASAANIRYMMKKHAALIIKPDRGSVGKGIMKLQSGDNGKWSLLYPLVAGGKKRWRRAVFRTALPTALRRALRRKPYIAQQCLPLATYGGRPFDVRVSVQRGRDGMWHVTGMVAKAAARGRFLTNVAQGGTVLRLERILREYPALNAQTVERDFAAFALRIACHLSAHVPELADIGLDVGMSEQGKPLFIECNCKDQRYSFLEGGMTDIWNETYRRPMGYARYLLERRR